MKLYKTLTRTELTKRFNYPEINLFSLYKISYYTPMDYKIQRYLKITMKYGVNLRGDSYYLDSYLPYPTIVFRTPYGHDDPQYKKIVKFFASRAFSLLNFDVRGRGYSEG